MSNLLYPSEIVYAFGFSRWKQRLLQQFLPNKKILFVRNLIHVPSGATLLVWGHRKQKKYYLDPSRSINIVSVEDGFLRSVGLGAGYQIKPFSWVIDQTGIYFDSSSPSDLEHLLCNHEFSFSELSRARSIRIQIIEYGLTKYNVGQENFSGFASKAAKSASLIILVPGQVESDASIRCGSPLIRTNIDLLRTVRTDNPNAYIAYKPHPDVVSGFRAKGKDENQVRIFCNEIITDVSLHSLLQYVDEVHVLTSLSGFEALLRGKKVVCYGQPFYAGWGLTTDKIKIPRRTRQLSLDELIAASLLIYPSYISTETGRLISAEAAIQELLSAKANPCFQTFSFRLLALLHKLITFLRDIN